MLEFNLLKRYPLANVKNIWCLRGQIQSKPIYGLVTYEMAGPYDKSTKAVSIEFAANCKTKTIVGFNTAKNV